MHKILHIAKKTNEIVSLSYPVISKYDLFKTYLKIKKKQIMSSAKKKENLKQENIFGFNINFFNYDTFIILFEDIFCNQTYYFSSSKKAPIIIDCGSNVGMSIIYFKMLYPESEIIAFEADPSTYKVLKKNIEQNNLKSVTAYNYALADSEDKLQFYCDESNPGSLMASINERGFLKNSIEVQAKLLSGFIKEKIDFLKMDIEGAESDVIGELYKRRKINKVEKMTIEYHHHLDDSDRMSHILSILEKNNFGYNLGSVYKNDKLSLLQDIMIYAYKKEKNIIQ